MNSLTDWNLVRTFLAVAEHLHRADAAQQLGISVRTLARHIRELEDELGVVLVSRRQGTSLTATGVWLRDALRRPLAEADDALQQARHGTTPVLRIAISTELPGRWAARLGNWVHDCDSSARLELRAHEQTLELLHAGEFDLALVTGERPDQRSQIVGHEPAVVVFPADHPAAGRRAIRGGDLADLPAAISDVSLPDRRRELLTRLHGHPDAPSISVQRLATIGQALLQAARSRHAATIVLDAAAAQSDTTGLAVRPLDPPYTVAVSLLARDDLPREVFASIADHVVDVPR